MAHGRLERFCAMYITAFSHCVNVEQRFTEAYL
jgi:hypothetical protein